MIDNANLKDWIDESIQLCQPDKTILLNGSLEEKQKLEQEAVSQGELLVLNQEKRPGCFYHRSDPDDVARAEHLTYICTSKKEEAGPTNNWMAPTEGYDRAKRFFKGSMKGRTMYIIPFSMGRVGSEFSKIGVQLTDSLYVALSMRMMTHVGEEVLKKLGPNGEFTRCLHSKADLDISKRLILHFPEDNTIWSVGSGYGGNALLGKKCMALRMGSYLGKKEGWMAEHMLIMGVEDPTGHISYVAAAFPSACGKTNLAMIKPPRVFQEKGYKVWTVGDDIAWLRIGEDGYLYAVNPEAGLFGVIPGTNSRTNPHAAATFQKNAIFTNVLLTKDKDVWWEDGDAPPPKEGINWKGDPWKPGMKDKENRPIRGAHPNSRFTAPLQQCPTFSNEYNNPKGVRISAVIFGGRHARVSPLVYESRSWNHGVFMGATMSSERTAAQMGKQGEVRRDPMAMLPFCGYNMADYFQHWLDMGQKMAHPPKIFHVNWFRKDESGKFLWPGFSENFRVILWILNRCQGKGKVQNSPIGFFPEKEDFILDGLSLGEKEWDSLFSIEPEIWRKDIENQEGFFKKFETHLPKEIANQLEELKKNLL